MMKSTVSKHSIVIAGHRTSISLEEAFWKGLREIARGRNLTVSELASIIDSERAHANLSSAIRLFVLDHYGRMAAAAGDRTLPNTDTARSPAPLYPIADTGTLR